jgi:hypothetical protein
MAAREKNRAPRKSSRRASTVFYDVEEAPPETFHGFSDRDWAFMLLRDLDYDAQQLAIRSFLRYRNSADEKFERELKEIIEFQKKARGSASFQAGNEYVDHMHGKVFQDAAHSLAAVGMLAPFIESLFEQGFYGIRDLFGRTNLKLSSLSRRKMKIDRRWNCHYVTNTRQDLVKGIFDLAAATGLDRHLPSELRLTLDALYGYRNKNFHLGFEWPVRERTKFADRIRREDWPSDWFEQSSSGGEPWIFYLSDSFVTYCLKMVEAVLESYGRFFLEINRVR